MLESDIAPFAQMLEDVWTLYPNAKPLTSGQGTMFFRALASFPLSEVQRGFDLHVKDAQRGRFPPVPADVIAQIEGQVADDGRPGPEEAWSIALVAIDENKTVVWTDEIAAAWSIASSVQASGDDIGARMTFKEAYSRLVSEARAARKPAAWVESIGFDPTQRATAVIRAQALGRLPAPPKKPGAEQLEGPDRGFQPLLENPEMPAHVREAIARTRERILARGDESPQVEAERQRLADLKAQTQARVDAHLQKTGEGS